MGWHHRPGRRTGLSRCWPRLLSGHVRPTGWCASPGRSRIDESKVRHKADPTSGQTQLSPEDQIIMRVPGEGSGKVGESRSTLSATAVATCSMVRFKSEHVHAGGRFDQVAPALIPSVPMRSPSRGLAPPAPRPRRDVLRCCLCRPSTKVRGGPRARPTSGLAREQAKGAQGVLCAGGGRSIRAATGGQPLLYPLPEALVFGLGDSSVVERHRGLRLGFYGAAAPRPPLARSRARSSRACRVRPRLGSPHVRRWRANGLCARRHDDTGAARRWIRRAPRNMDGLRWPCTTG